MRQGLRAGAVIATRNRPHVLKQCLDSITNQVDVIVIVDNGDTEPATRVISRYAPVRDLTIYRIADDEQPVNISRLWNLGLEQVRQALQRGSTTQWDVAVLNDDAIVPPGWLRAVSSGMRIRRAAAGCSDPNGRLREPILHLEAGPVDLSTRMVGWAHVLCGEIGLRYDENLHWWFGDDDMDWRSREVGGMVMIPGLAVQNQFPNGQMSPELHARVALDREAFVRKWKGMTPW